MHAEDHVQGEDDEQDHEAELLGAGHARSFDAAAQRGVSL
jgi:hypothetical protein